MFVLNSSMSLSWVFFPGVKIVSKLSASTVIILTPGHQFVQSSFNCREELRPKSGCCGYYTVGLCFSLPFIFYFVLFSFYFLLQVHAKYIPTSWLQCYPEKMKTKFKFVLFEAFLHSLKKSNLSRKFIVFYMFIIYFLGVFLRKVCLSMHLLLIDTVKYWNILVKV